ncbi:MAG TPA: hypothetical protein VHI78_04800 [Bacteroidales bacterium]|jgi:hypothetical protein|nr:hypothetical protein [Bacteroidales bacterium]
MVKSGHPQEKAIKMKSTDILSIQGLFCHVILWKAEKWFKTGRMIIELTGLVPLSGQKQVIEITCQRL